jgi:hypothetical protein
MGKPDFGAKSTETVRPRRGLAIAAVAIGASGQTLAVAAWAVRLEHLPVHAGC